MLKVQINLKSFMLAVSFVFLASIVIRFAAIIYGVNEARKARFTVEVLNRYLRAYERTEGINIKRLADLPDFEIVSVGESLSLSSADLKISPILGGYIYDMQYVSPDQYTISASPIGLFTLPVEFGVTQDGQVRKNSGSGVDAEADSYEEMKLWDKINQSENIRTKQLPAYLQN
jgi:hypothetical protein